MANAVSGKLEAVTEVVKRSEGTTKKGKKWTLWGATLTVGGIDYGVSGFSKGALEKRIEHLRAGQGVQFEAEPKGDFMNITEDSKITVVEIPEEPAEEELKVERHVVEDVPETKTNKKEFWDKRDRYWQDKFEHDREYFQHTKDQALIRRREVAMSQAVEVLKILSTQEEIKEYVLDANGSINPKLLFELAKLVEKHNRR